MGQSSYTESQSPSGLTVIEKETPLEWYFPEVDSGRTPLGDRVQVQLRRTKRTSAGGIALVSETKDTEMWNTQIAKVIKVGPIAYKNRTTGETWYEGQWIKPGDFVIVPRWGGTRWEVVVGDDVETALFCTFKDHEVIDLVTCDPRKVKAFIL